MVGDLIRLLGLRKVLKQVMSTGNLQANFMPDFWGWDTVWLVTCLRIKQASPEKYFVGPKISLIKGPLI